MVTSQDTYLWRQGTTFGTIGQWEVGEGYLVSPNCRSEMGGVYGFYPFTESLSHTF